MTTKIIRHGGRSAAKSHVSSTFNPLHAEMFYLHFRSFVDIEILQVVKIWSHERQLRVYFL